MRLIDADDLINTLGISNNDIYCEETIEEYILDNGTLSFAEPERKKGHWVYYDEYAEAVTHTCSECGKRMTTAIGVKASFCWNCGADMRGEQNE